MLSPIFMLDKMRERKKIERKKTVRDKQRRGEDGNYYIDEDRWKLKSG